MPRSINLKAMHWKTKAEYGHNEAGAGTEVGDKDSLIGAFLDSDDGYKAAKSKLGEFEWEMVDESSKDKSKQPSTALNTRADEIFKWAQDNLKGKWMLYECFAYRFSCAYSTYLIEDRADRDRFQQKWGDLYKYTKPTSKNPSRVLTAFEEAQKKRSAESLKQAFESSSRVLPLYKGLPETWTFAVANIEGEEKLLILPNSKIGDITCLYGDKIDKNAVRQLAGILEGKNHFTASGVFMDLVKGMFGTADRDTFRAREVDGYRFGLVVKKSGADNDKEQSYHSDVNDISIFRNAYKAGQDVTFYFGGASFTFNSNSPLVAYKESERSGTAISDGRGGLTHGEYYDNVEGQYNRATGNAEGTWKRSTGTHGGVGGGHTNSTAVYKDGRLLKGSLGADEHYQPAPPTVTTLGRKTAAPK